MDETGPFFLFFFKGRNSYPFLSSGIVQSPSNSCPPNMGKNNSYVYMIHSNGDRGALFIQTDGSLITTHTNTGNFLWDASFVLKLYPEDWRITVLLCRWLFFGWRLYRLYCESRILREKKCRTAVLSTSCTDLVKHRQSVGPWVVRRSLGSSVQPLYRKDIP